jgi:hypothetical protein
MHTHGKDPAHGKASAALQRSARMAKAFAMQFGHAHGNVRVAVGAFAVQTFPCIHARQSLCRAKKGLYRMICRTATASFPVVHTCKQFDGAFLFKDFHMDLKELFLVGCLICSDKFHENFNFVENPR